jgi:hypothetical protein
MNKKLNEYYDASQYLVSSVDQDRRRKPKLTLTHLNKLRKKRELKRLELEQRKNSASDIYGSQGE